MKTLDFINERRELLAAGYIETTVKNAPIKLECEGKIFGFVHFKPTLKN